MISESSIPPLRVVCATRLPRERFLLDSETGRSIKAYFNISRVEVRLYSENMTGLSELYNKAIEESVGNPALLVFVHDDIFFSDFFWEKRVRDALNEFDIVGLAGNVRRVPNQPSWAFINQQMQWDEQINLSGVVGHGSAFPPTNLIPYGPVGKQCKLLDGCFLAVKSQKLIESGLRFDPNFKFHFYDLDFCRSAEKLGLTMGTMALSIVHASAGNFASDAWHEAYGKYINKWKS